MAARGMSLLPRSPVKRYLPPLLLLLLLAGVGLRVAMRPGCEEDRERIRDLLLDPTQHNQALLEIEAHLEGCSGVTDHWFAAEAYLRAGRYADALARVVQDPRLAGQPEGDKRFARIGLEVLGWKDVEREQPRGFAEVEALSTLVEGGVPWAEARLLEYARTRPLVDVTQFFFYASRYTSRRPLDVLMRGFRTHVTRAEGDSRAIELAAAFTQMGPEPYPERQADLALLFDAFARLRRSNKDAWVASALALGKSGEPRAVEALRATVKKLDGTTAPSQQRDLVLARCGLLAAGDWTQHAALKPVIEDQTPHPFLTAWYLEALLHRYLVRDPQARVPLGDVWLFLGQRDKRARFRMAVALLLQEAPPPVATPKERAPIEKMVKDLLASQNSPRSRVAGLSYLMRIGDPGAREKLLGMLSIIADAWEADPKAMASELRSAFILALRALLLYTDTAVRAP